MASPQITSIFLKSPGGWSSLSGDGAAVPSRGALLLVPFATLSVHPFSFAFRSPKDVRDALALRFRPLLSGEAPVEVLPMVLGRKDGGVSGAAWCLSGEEIPDAAPGLPLEKNVVWPLPLALASAVNGDGIAVYSGEGLLASALFRKGVPLFCRCRAPEGEEDGAEEEKRWCLDLAASLGEEMGEEDIWIGEGEELLRSAAEATASRYPAFFSVNFSRPALAASRARERTAGMYRRLAAWAAAAGLFFCLIQWTLAGQIRSSVAAFSQQGETLYREVFGSGERVVDPLSQARGKIALLSGGGKKDNSLSLLLARLGKAWTEEGSRRGDFPVLEQLRFSGEGLDVTGTAERMEAISALRTAAGGEGFRPSIGDIQQIPGGGLRFTLSLKRSES
ncbi:hypothetical protein MASR2M79_01550 [Aminivibrio sp.]